MLSAASLPEEVVDAEDLALVERLVQRVVQLHRAREVGAERLLHDDARALGQARPRRAAARLRARPRAERSGSAGARRRRRARLRARRRSSPAPRCPPTGTRRRGATRTSSQSSSGTPWCANSSSAPRANARKPSSSRSSSDVPTIRHSGSSPACARWNSPGRSLRRARSPVAPNSTITCGRSGEIRLELMSVGSDPTTHLSARFGGCEPSRRNCSQGGLGSGAGPEDDLGGRLGVLFGRAPAPRSARIAATRRAFERPQAPAPSAATAPSAMAQRAPNCCDTQPTIGPPIGVLPRNSIAWSASTRPRISGAGFDLHDRRRRDEERDARDAEERARTSTRTTGSARTPSAPSRRRSRATPWRRCATLIVLRRAVRSAPTSAPTLTTENSSVNVVPVAVQVARGEQREDGLEVVRQRADDGHHHERHPELGHAAHVAQPFAHLALGLAA